MHGTKLKENLLLLKDLLEPWRIKSCKYNTSISNNVYIDKLDNIFNKDKNTYLRTIKKNSIKPSTQIHFGVENNNRDLKFEFGNDLKISKYKNFLQRLHAKLV